MGKKVNPKVLPNAVGIPLIELQTAGGDSHTIVVEWAGKQPGRINMNMSVVPGEQILLQSTIFSQFNISDPQGVLEQPVRNSKLVTISESITPGYHALFVQTKQGAFSWWQPVDIYIPSIQPAVERQPVIATANKAKVELGQFFNDKVTHIFKPQYKSPRPVSPTLQLPIQGIGNWAYHSVQFNVIDSGLRARAGVKNEWTSSTGVPFTTPSDTAKQYCFHVYVDILIRFSTRFH